MSQKSQLRNTLGRGNMGDWLNQWLAKIEEGDVGAIILLAIVGAVLNEVIRR